MARYVAGATPIDFIVAGNLSVADDLFFVTLPFSCRVVAAEMNLVANGDTSGNTDVVLESTAQGDLWTVGAGKGRLAHDSAALFLYWDRTNFAITELVAGDTISVNVNAIPGGTTSSGLFVRLWVQPSI